VRVYRGIRRALFANAVIGGSAKFAAGLKALLMKWNLMEKVESLLDGKNVFQEVTRAGRIPRACSSRKRSRSGQESEETAGGPLPTVNKGSQEREIFRLLWLFLVYNKVVSNVAISNLVSRPT